MNIELRKYTIQIDQLLLLLLVCLSFTAYVPIMKYMNIFILLLFSLSLIKGNALIQTKTFITLLFTASDYLIFFGSLVFIPLIIYQYILKPQVNKVEITVLMFLLYASFSCVIGMFQEVSLLSYPFWIVTFATSLFIFLYYLKSEFSKEDKNNILSFFYKIIVLQLLIAPIQIYLLLGRFKHGDSGVGSVGDAHVLGYYFMLLLIYILVDVVVLKNKKLTVFSFLLMPFVFWVAYLVDAKMIYFLLVLAIPFYFLFFILLFQFLNKKMFSLKKIATTFLFSSLIGLSLPVLVNYYLSQLPNAHGLTISNVFETYLDVEYGHHGYKAEVYKRTYTEMYSDFPYLWYVFGTGPGKFDSRASNVLAYDTLAKEGKKLTVVPAFSSDMTKRYLTDLYTKEIKETAGSRSAILSYPFAGLVSIKAESGLFGLLFYISICMYISLLLIYKVSLNQGNIYNKSCVVLSFMFFSFPFLLFIDNFQEQPHFSFVLFLLAGLLLAQEKKLKYKEVDDE